MKKLLSFISSHFTSTLRDILFFVGIFAASILAIWFTFTAFLEMSTFAVAISKAAIGCFLLYLVDMVLLRDIDTLSELKKGNISYAIYYAGYALVIALCIAAA